MSYIPTNSLFLRHIKSSFIRQKSNKPQPTTTIGAVPATTTTSSDGKEIHHVDDEGDGDMMSEVD
jgi:hypothetical protein